MKYIREKNCEKEIFEGTVQEISELVMSLPERLLPEELFLGKLGECFDEGADDNIVRGKIEV